MLAHNKRLVSCFMDIGEILLVSGAEVHRIEDTITRICHAYGFTRVDIFTITTSIILTVHTENDEEIITQTRRISRFDTDLHRVALVNALSRDICDCKPSLDYIQEQLRLIQALPLFSKELVFCAYAMIAAAFTLFYGGGFFDAVCAAIAGFVMRAFLLLGYRIHLQTFILNFFTSAVTGLTIVGLSSLGLGQNVNATTMGCVMLLIPGLAMTSSFRDMISGDTISGLLGLTEALLRATAIALGFALVLMQMGG